MGSSRATFILYGDLAIEDETEVEYTGEKQLKEFAKRILTDDPLSNFIEVYDSSTEKFIFSMKKVKSGRVLEAEHGEMPKRRGGYRPGAGRPPKPKDIAKTDRILFWIPTPTKEQIYKQAKKVKTDVSDYCRTAVLNKLYDVDGVQEFRSKPKKPIADIPNYDNRILRAVKALKYRIWCHRGSKFSFSYLMITKDEKGYWVISYGEPVKGEEDFPVVKHRKFLDALIKMVDWLYRHPKGYYVK